MQFLFPYDGCMLNANDGAVDGVSLTVRVRLSTYPGRRILIGGREAEEEAPGIYTAPFRLDGYRNTLTAYDRESGELCRAAVYWLPKACGVYRLSLDDNIWFLRDLARNRYSSLFDNPYMHMLRSLHDEFGTKVHINIYYQCEDFNLSEMPDSYRPEWRANADWLRLTFHAKQDKPDRLYRFTTYDEMRHDYLQVTHEILRFAGPELLTPVTDIHWGACTVEGVRALRALGIRALTGYYYVDGAGRPDVSYYMTRAQVEAFNGRDFMRDEAEDMIYTRSDIILNDGELSGIVPALEAIKKDPKQSGFLELLIHEQYFYPFYERYLPDYEERVRTAVRWADQNGYKPAFVHEVALENGLHLD